MSGTQTQPNQKTDQHAKPLPDAHKTDAKTKPPGSASVKPADSAKSSRS